LRAILLRRRHRRVEQNQSDAINLCFSIIAAWQERRERNRLEIESAFSFDEMKKIKKIHENRKTPSLDMCGSAFSSLIFSARNSRPCALGVCFHFDSIILRKLKKLPMMLRPAP
jgi:hypothetical protein